MWARFIDVWKTRLDFKKSKEVQAELPVEDDELPPSFGNESDDDLSESENDSDIPTVVSCKDETLVGWSWHHYDDGSGCLKNADSSYVIHYDRTSYYLSGWTEYMIQDGANYHRWTPFENSWTEFIKYAESLAKQRG